MSGRIADHFVRAPVNFQTWQYLTFLHWSYEPSVVQALVPEELTVQQWDRRTWVGITPFQMARVRGPFRIPIPGWEAFPELNVRAYVRTEDGRDGIWFLGMVVPRYRLSLLPGVWGYRISDLLPRCRSTMLHGHIDSVHHIRSSCCPRTTGSTRRSPWGSRLLKPTEPNW